MPSRKADRWRNEPSCYGHTDAFNVLSFHCNAQEICDQLAEFVRAFPSLTDGERKLVVDALIREVALKHKEVAVVLTPPLSGLGFLTPSLAPKEEKRNVPELRIFLNYHLAAYNGANAHCTTRVGAGFSGREHMLKSPEPSAQAFRSCAILRGFAAPTVQTAGAACATAPAL